jgi:hypothetical protein
MRLSLRGAACVLAACVAFVLILSCGGDGEPSVTGVIIDVQSPSLTEVDSFTVRDGDGREFVFGVAPEAAPDPREGFTPQHLRSHSVLGQRVKIFYRSEGQTLLALRLKDQ